MREAAALIWYGYTGMVHVELYSMGGAPAACATFTRHPGPMSFN